MVLVPGSLLRLADERANVGGVRDRFHDEVQVVGHEAVRKNRNALPSRDGSNLQEDAIDNGPTLEPAPPIRRAHRQEIPLAAEVHGWVQSGRSSAGHGQWTRKARAMRGENVGSIKSGLIAGLKPRAT
jgi:hypothetical protein